MGKKTSKKASGRSGGRGAPSRPTPDASMRIVVLRGPEDFLRTLYTRKFAEILEAEHGQVDTIRFDGQDAAAADVLDEARSFGLLAGHKMIVVDNADQLLKEGNRALFERYAEEPSEGATLLLRADKWNSGNLDKAIKKVGAFIDCTPESPERAARWAVRRCEQVYGAALDPRTALMLVERIGTDLGRLDGEVGKLASGAGEGGAITPALLDELSGRTREQEVWSIQAELARGDPQAAVHGVRDRLEVARLPETLICYAMLQLAARLHAACGLAGQGLGPGQIASQLKLWGDSRDVILNACRRMRLDDAAELLNACIDADRRMKTGLGDSKRTLEGLAVRFAQTL